MKSSVISDISDIPQTKVHPHVWTGGPRMGSQLRGTCRERTIDMLFESDGPFCRAKVCHLGRRFGSAEALNIPGFRYKVFTVDHVDGNAGAHWFDNERLAHWICNNADDKQHQRHSSRRGRENGAGLRELPTEIDLNVRLYARYQKWLEDRFFSSNKVPVEEAIFTAAREIHAKLGHGAHQTIRGYLQVLTTGDGAPYLVDSEKKVLLRRTSYEPEARK